VSDFYEELIRAFRVSFLAAWKAGWRKAQEGMPYTQAAREAFREGRDEAQRGSADGE
jgi:hypothetical protein